MRTTFEEAEKGLEPIYSCGATDPHAASMALPIYGPIHELIGALVISGPASRLTEEHAKRLGKAFAEVADDLMRSLGGKSLRGDKQSSEVGSVGVAN